MPSGLFHEGLKQTQIISSVIKANFEHLAKQKYLFIDADTYLSVQVRKSIEAGQGMKWYECKIEALVNFFEDFDLGSFVNSV